MFTNQFHQTWTGTRNKFILFNDIMIAKRARGIIIINNKDNKQHLKSAKYKNKF